MHENKNTDTVNVTHTFITLIVVMVSEVYAYVRTHQNVCIKYVQIFVCFIQLKKVEKNKKKMDM